MGGAPSSYCIPAIIIHLFRYGEAPGPCVHQDQAKRATQIKASCTAEEWSFSWSLEMTDIYRVRARGEALVGHAGRGHRVRFLRI
uniref:Uncharacterized protein n=1 Tax=Oryza barthii TaxID=65489 RepID=A0A0D3FU93_9ORYZ